MQESISSSSGPVRPYLKPPKRKLLAPVYLRFIQGTSQQRNTYSGLKEFFSRNALAARRRLAEQSIAEGAFEIPRDTGFIVCPPDTFAGTAELIAHARQLVAEVDPENQPGKKAQLKMYMVDISKLTLDSPYLRFALRPDILAAVSKYLGIVPVLSDIDVWYSHYKDPTPTSSQLYHCDPEDVAQVKVFLYADEVTPQNGPLVLVDAKTSEDVRNKLGYTFDPDNRKVTDEAFLEAMGERQEFPVIGPAGTCVFADTCRCFHYGSRVKEAALPRILVHFKYLRPSAFVYPLNFRRKAPFRKMASPELSTMQRMVLGAE
jgi:hypothetical protein